MKILIRTDGGLQLGNGHIIRMQALAKEFSSRSIPFAFALKQDEFWLAQLERSGFIVHKLSPNVDDLAALIKENKYSHLVYDTRNDLKTEELESLKVKLKIKVIVIDSPEDVRLAADAVIFPPIPQVKEWHWNGFDGKIFSGWEYVLLRSEFSARHRAHTDTHNILLSFGSTDPFQLTEWALDEIAEHPEIFVGYTFQIMVGPQFDRIEKIRKAITEKNIKAMILQAPSNVAEIFDSVDFAIIALGVTAYELASKSVPFLYVAISDDHARSGQAFERSGLGFSLGIVNKNLENLADKVAHFKQQLSVIRKNLTQFQSQVTIGDWSKIINAVIE